MNSIKSIIRYMFLLLCQLCFIQVTVRWKYKGDDDLSGPLKSYFAWNEDIPAAIKNFQDISEKFQKLTKIVDNKVEAQIA